MIQAEKTNYKSVERDQSKQTVGDMMHIIQEAKIPSNAFEVDGQFMMGMADPDEDVDTEDVGISGDSWSGTNECP